MSNSKVIIGKNLVLLTLVVITILSLFRGLFEKSDLLIIQVAMGLTYTFLCYLEYNTTSYKAQLPVERFWYYPSSFYMFRFIKVGIYLTFALVLYFSPSAVKILFPVCLIIAFTEIIIGILKYVKKLCFVSIYANYLLISLEGLEKIFANEIDYVEYRHGIFYIIKKSRGTKVIKTFSISNKELFVGKMREWIKNNQVKINQESLDLLNK